MEKYQLQIVLKFLEERRENFITESNEFHKMLSPSCSWIDPNFSIDLSLLEEEIIHNLSFEDQQKITTYYQKVVNVLESVNFTESQLPYLPKSTVDYYKNRENFLDTYYSNNPNDKYGEGELEWIEICFNGYLDSYKILLQRIIETIQKQISKFERINEEVISGKLKKCPPLNQGLSDEKIIDIIYEHSKHLAGKNSRQEKIMSDDDFTRLQKDIYGIIVLKQLPEDIQPYELTGINGESIRYTLSQIHKKVYSGRNIDSNFALFLRYWFPQQFGEWKVTTIKSKLNKPQPKIYPY